MNDATTLRPGAEIDLEIALAKSHGHAGSVARLCRVREQLAAMSCPEGWKMVPVEPTPSMIHAGTDRLGGALYDASLGWGERADRVYRQMVQAAPAPLETPADTFAGKSETAENKAVLDCRGNSSDAPIESEMSSESEKAGAADPPPMPYVRNAAMRNGPCQGD